MDLNYGASSNVTPYNFGGTDYSGYNSLNTYGLGSTTGTLGAGVSSSTLGNTLEDGSGVSSLFGSSGLGLNIPTMQLGLGGISTLAGLYTGLKSLGLAQNQFDLSKQAYQTNLANSTKSYNTALSDKATARGVTEGQSSDQVASYIKANSL